jgi:hypothetical protein
MSAKLTVLGVQYMHHKIDEVGDMSCFHEDVDLYPFISLVTKTFV